MPKQSKDELARDFQAEADASWRNYQIDKLHLTLDELSVWLKTVGTEDECEMPECHR